MPTLTREQALLWVRDWSRYVSQFTHILFTTEIILKQLFTSVSVIIGEYSPRLRLGEYSPIITSTSVNNC